MESKFTGSFWGYVGRSLLTILLSVITCGIALPWCMCMIYKWQRSHTYVDGYQLEFDGNGFQLWGRIILWTFLSIITIGIYAFYLPIASEKWVAKHTHFA